MEEIIEYMGKKVPKSALEELGVLASKYDDDVKIIDCYQSETTLFGSSDKPEYDGDTWGWGVPNEGERKMFQFLGTNGSGKSTIPKGLVDIDKDAYIVESNVCWLAGNQGKGFVPTYKRCKLMTVCPNLGVILIGAYMPGVNITGCDLLVRATMTAALEYIEEAQAFGGMHIIMEGVVLSSSRWHIDYFRDDLGIIPTMLFMDTPYDVCVERLKSRNESQGKEFVNGKNVLSKWEETKTKAGRCIDGTNGYHGVDAQWVDHTMGIQESIEWFINVHL